MNPDPLVKAVAGLMTAQHSTAQSVGTLHQNVGTLHQTVGTVSHTVTRLSQTVTTLDQTVTTLSQTVASMDKTVASMDKTVGDVKESMAQEAQRLQELMDAVTGMAYSSVDTRKTLADTQSRLTALEADVAELKAKAS